MKIEVSDITVQNRNFVTKTGEQRTVYSQQVYLWKDNETYPIKARIPLESNQPYAIGYYSLGDSSYEVAQYGDISINRYAIKLIPLIEPSAKPLNFSK